MSKRPPRKIFLESTALFQLGPRLDNLYLSQLLAMRESIPFDVLIAEVSWMEYLRDRKREIRKCIERLRPITNELSNHGVALDKVDEAEQALCGYMDRIEEQFAKKAEAAGFHIVPMPDGLDIRRLLEMSIECTPPFEEPEAKSKEKGFRDSLIMFTILESIRGGTLDEALLITGDNLLGEGISLHAGEFETKIRVLPDLAAAVEFLEARMDEQNRGRVRAEAAEAKAMLEGFRDRLEARVREIRDLDDSDLGQGGPFIEHQENDAFNSTLGFLFKSPRDYVDIQRINSISFDHVETAVWKEKQEGAASILFMIACKAHAVVFAPHLATYSSTKKYEVGGPGKPWAGITLTSAPTPTMERDLDFHLFGEAQLRRPDGSTWVLSSLRLDKTLPSDEDLAALSDADLASRD